MSVEFVKVFLGLLTGAWDVVLNIASGEIARNISSQDFNSLLESCLEKAVERKSELLNRFTGPALPNGSRPLAYLNKSILGDFLRSNPLVKPMTSQVPSSTAWRPYLEPFIHIIVLPGCTLAEGDRLDLIQGVLEVASQLFESSVPYKHPAFEQLLLGYQRRQSQEHQQILREISTIPSKAAREVDQLRQAVLNGGATNHTAEITVADWVNPFSVVAADDLDLANPDHVKQIRNLFIARHSGLPTVRKRFNTVLEGQRGTGKTMILKYLGFETQILEWIDKSGGKSQEFFSSPQNFIGVYSKLGQGVYDKSDFEAIVSPTRREAVFEHRLVLQLLYDVLETMRSVFKHVSPPAQEVRRIRHALQTFLKADGTLDSSANHDELIRSAQDYISFKSVPEVDEYLGSVSPGSGGSADFNPRLTLSALLPFLKLLRESCKASTPFFLMLDDFDVLEPYQQACVFKVASVREFSTVCFKFGVMILGKKVSLSGPDRTFRAGDDYDPIDLDWTQGGLHENYQEAAMEIAAARLKDANWPDNLAALLPAWIRGAEIWEEVKLEMQKEWEEAGEKQTDSKSDYISKYGNARFFQRLRQSKISMRYAGLDYITMVSSGIFRQFLEACKLIFDRAHDRGWLPEHGGVNPEIQDEAMREYSEEMMQQFTRTSGDAQALLSGDIEVNSQHMVTLIESLSDLFYSRLHTPGHGEPEIICIAIRDDLNQCREASTYLNVAVRESILHRFQYPPKTAGGPPLPSYMLNRRLGPRRDLSIRRMQGRIEIEANHIILAVSERKKFFDSVTAKEEAEKSRQYKLKLENQQKN